MQPSPKRIKWLPVTSLASLMVSNHTIQFKLGTYPTHGLPTLLRAGKFAELRNGTESSINLLTSEGVSVLLSALITATVEVEPPVAAVSLSQHCGSKYDFRFVPMIVLSHVFKSKDISGFTRKQLSQTAHPSLE
jgi:hypothetical protein